MINKISDRILHKKPLLLLLALIIFAAGFMVGQFSNNRLLPLRKAPRATTEMRLGGYDFINPLLECESAKDSFESRELRPFRHKLESLIEEQKKKGWASHVSVYFREMNNGLSFDIDGKEHFSPASLIKVPLLIAYFKWAETDHSLMRKKLTFTSRENFDANQNIKPAFSIEYGKSYFIEDLIFRSIAYSDNNAFYLLFVNVNQTILRQTYTDLGLEVPTARTIEDSISVSDYASFFRILFNASYLNHEMSEKALEYLSDVDYKEGLVGGVPPETVVSHKFGERALTSPAGTVFELHDCGIVYYRDHPYLLCVMTKGKSFEYLDDAIREVSHLVYEEIEHHYPGQ